MWSFDKTLTATAYAPSYEFVGRGDFAESGLPMAPNQTVEMRLIDARWSLSPQRGREAWDVVQAEIRLLSLCATLFVSPALVMILAPAGLPEAVDKKWFFVLRPTDLTPWQRTLMPFLGVTNPRLRRGWYRFWPSAVLRFR